MDYSLPGPSVRGIFQARILEWVATPCSRGMGTESVCQSLSHVRLFAALWTVACQTPLSVGFSRQEYWSGLPRLPPGNLPDPRFEPMSLPDPGFELMSLMSPALVGRFFTTLATWEALSARESKSEREVAQLCLTLFNPMVCSLPRSSVHGIFQATVLEWVAISFSELLEEN